MPSFHNPLYTRHDSYKCNGTGPFTFVQMYCIISHLTRNGGESLLLCSILFSKGLKPLITLIIFYSSLNYHWQRFIRHLHISETTLKWESGFFYKSKETNASSWSYSQIAFCCNINRIVAEYHTKIFFRIYEYKDVPHGGTP